MMRFAVATLVARGTSWTLHTRCTAWMSGSRWHGRSVLRISVCNWSTTDQDVERSLEALRKAAG